jgi:CheY-like chemotaxis protein
MNGNRILIVDDDEILRDLLAMHLEIEGYDVLAAPDGQEALALLGREPVDLVLLDLMMPVMDGVRFIEALSEAPHRPAVVVLSAAGHGERERSLKQAGARFVIRKPIEPAELLRCVGSALAHGA